MVKGLFVIKDFLWYQNVFKKKDKRRRILFMEIEMRKKFEIKPVGKSQMRGKKDGKTKSDG